MRKSIFAIVLLIILTGTCLTGCSKANIGGIDVGAGESAVYIGKNGKVSYAIGEAFDKDYYNKDDLKNIIKKEINDFNTGPYSETVDAAKVESFKVEDELATAIISFKSVKDFIRYLQAYNGEEKDAVYIGKISDASSEGFDIAGEFTRVKEGAITQDTALSADIKKMDSDIIIINEKIKIGFEDNEVQYISAHCSVENGVVTVNNDETAYIVYK